MAIDYIICAAGAGTRTKDINPYVAKPMLLLQEKTLLEWSISSLEIYPGDQLIVAAQRNQVETSIIKKLRSNHPGVVVTLHELESLTRGQLETAVLTAQHWKPNHGLVIFNSDTYFRARPLLAAMANPEVDGLLPCSRESGDSWSFCRVKSPEEILKPVTEVTEKKRISEWCSVGYYYFKDQKRFLAFAAEELRTGGGSEYYVAPLYNRYLADGAGIFAVEVDRFMPMGSLDQLQKYWGCSLLEMRRANPRGTIVVDLDNTITIEDPNVPYAKKQPRLDVIQKLREYRELGFQIVLFTARRMKTHRHNEAMAIADVGLDTLNWLNQNDVPFDGIRFGKPHADRAFYVDDRAIRPSEFVNEAFETLELRFRE